MKYFYCIFFTFLSVFSIAENTDSLIYKLNDLAFKIRNSNSDSSLIISQKAYSLAIKNNDTKGEIISLKNIANHYRITNRYKKAITKFHETEKLAIQLNDSILLAIILNNMGLTYKNEGLYDSALIYFHKAINTNNTIEQKKYSLHNIGVTYSLLENYETSIEYFERCLKIYESIKDTIGIANMYNSIGGIYYDKSEGRKALSYFNKYLKLTPPTEKYDLSLGYSNIGATYEALDILDSAFLFTSKALLLSRQINDDLGILIGLTNTANILAKQHKKLAALNIYRQALSFSDSIGALNEKKEILLSISETHKELKQFDKSLYYFEMYTVLKDSIIGGKTQQLIVKEQEKYNAAEREKDIIKLRAERNEKAQSEQLLKITIIGIILFGLAIAAFVYFIIKERNKKRKIRNEQKVMQSMLDAEERTKEEISREIHDSVATKLSLIQQHFAVYKDSIPKEKYVITENLFSVTSDALRSISHKLYSSNLKDQGLAYAIKNLFNDLNELNGNKRYYFFTNMEEGKRLKESEELNLFRITEELINNTNKYANASRIDIELEDDEGKINYFFTDNGIGFDYATVKKGIGLDSIRTRAKSIGLKATFNTSNDKGLEVTVN